MKSPITLGLDSEAVLSASPRLWLESSSPDTLLGHKSTCSESQLLSWAVVAVDRLARARPPLRGSVRVGSVCVPVPVPVAAAEATADTHRGRNLGRKQGLAPDPTGGSAAAPGPRPGLYDSAGRGRVL